MVNFERRRAARRTARDGGTGGERSGVPAVELAFSNLNLPRRQIAVLRPDALRRILAATGYHDAEVTPTRSFMRRLTGPGCATDDTDGQRLVGSVHQTFALAPGPALLDALRRRSLTPIGSAAVLPPVTASLSALRRLQDYAGHLLPAVLYADHLHTAEPVTYDRHNAPFGPRLVQPSEHLFRTWRLDRAGRAHGRPGLRDRLGQAGLDGVCVDTFHLRNHLDGHAVLDRLAADGVPVGELHVSLGRHDITTADRRLRERTGAELAAALRGARALAATECGGLLLRAAQLWRSQHPGGDRRLRAVVEVPASALGRTDLVQAHQRLVGHVGELLAAA